MWRSILERLIRHPKTTAEGFILAAVLWQSFTPEWRQKLAGGAIIAAGALWKLLSKDASQKFVTVASGGMVMDPTWKAPDADSPTIRGKH